MPLVRVGRVGGERRRATRIRVQLAFGMITSGYDSCVRFFDSWRTWRESVMVTALLAVPGHQ